MERVEIAIIGTGPAGVSAALTASNRNKRILLFGSREMSPKVAKAHEIRNYPGLPFVKGEDLAGAFREQLDRMGIAVTEKRIGAVYAMGDYFALQAGEEMIEAETVILATGVVQAKPLPGEEELLGRGVSYCATCDAPLYRGKTAAVIGYSSAEEKEAAFLNDGHTGNRHGDRTGRRAPGRENGRRGVSRGRRVHPAGRGRTGAAGARAGDRRTAREGKPQHGDQPAGRLRLRGHCWDTLPVCEGSR